jgi:hypothetical protein
MTAILISVLISIISEILLYHILSDMNVQANMVDGEQLDGQAVSAIAEAKHWSQWPIIGWVTKNLLSRPPPCFGRHVKLLVPVAFAIVSTHSSFKEG